MKGLVIKDLMCLRKQFIIFSYVVIAVLVMSIMFVLSARFGNIALANESMMAKEGMSSIDIKNLSTWTLILFMLLPVAMVGDVAALFTEDGKAGFANVSAVMPLPISKRVMAKYLTVHVMFGIGVCVDLVISFVLSLLTDIISFTEFFGIIISAASLMSIYGALVIVFCFLYGYGKENYAILCSCVLVITTAILVNLDRIKSLFVPMEAEVGEEASISLDYFMNFFKHRFYILLMIAIITMVISYFASLWIAKRKRGVV
ncbi:MAG: ABC-2 transporter permease [Acetatifactor sp.]